MYSIFVHVYDYVVHRHPQKSPALAVALVKPILHGV